MTLVWLLASSLVWGAVLVAAGLAIQRMTDASGRTRQWIWRGAAMLLIAPWLAAPLVDALNLGLAPAPLVAEPATFANAELAAAAPILTPAVTPAGVQPLLPAFDPIELVLIALGAGWIVRFVMAQFAARQLGGLIGGSVPAEEGHARRSLRSWSRRLGLRREPDLRIVASGVSPFSCGVFRPVICLPHELERGLDPVSLDLVVGHESIHVARGDGWLRPVERLVADLLWFNPFAWRIRRELDMARELACDETVVELTSAHRAYARTLRDVAGLAAGLPRALPAASMSLSGNGRTLVLRVSRSLDKARRRPARAAVMGALLLGHVGAPIAVGQVVLATPRHPAPPAQPALPAKPALAPSAATPVAFDQPAPPAPPAPPAAPVEAEEAADAPEAPEAPEAPPAPAPVPAPDPVPAPLAIPSVNAVPAIAPLPPATPRSRATPAPPLPALPPAASGQLSPLTPLPPLPPRGAGVLVPDGYAYAYVTPAPPAPPPAPGEVTVNASAAVIVGPATISSKYGARLDPFSGQMAWHEGVDIAKASGSAVSAPAVGTVTFAGVKGMGGRTVELQLDRQPSGPVTLRFTHLNEIRVKTGDTVKAGDVIGTVGSSGVSTGAHVHLEVLKNGQPYDPEKVDGLTLVAPN